MGDLTKDDNKTRGKLIQELSELRLQNAALGKTITGNRSAELAVEKGRYAERIIDTLHEPLIVLDHDLRVVSANDFFYEVFKVKPEKTVGQFIYDLGNKQWNIPKLRELLETILPSKATFDNYEVEHYFPSIGRHIMLLNAREIKKVLGQEEIILLAIEDITERKRIESLVTESEGLYRGVFETASDGIMLLEKREGKITHTNPAVERMLGYSTKECIGSKLNDIGFVLDLSDFQTTMLNLNKNGVINYTDVPVTTRTGQHIDTDIYLVDKTRVVQCNIRDITDRKQAAEALRESEFRYHLLFDEAQDGIALANEETGEILDCNQALCFMTGKNKTEILGQPQSILHSPHRLINGHSSSFPVPETEDPGKSIEDNLLSKSGKMIPVEIRSSRVRTNGGDYLLGIFRDITDRKLAEKKLLQILVRLRKALNTTIQVMVSTIETKDPYTAGHQIRSATLAWAIAIEMGLTQDKIDGLRMASSIHDIGKLSIPAEILSKPTKLSEIEFSLIKEHPQKGYEILRNIESPWPLAEIVFQHHERMDGSGYPRGLKGDDILVEARVLMVADVVEAMATHRPYRPALGIDKALEEISHNKGILYDPEVVEVCLRLFNEKGYKLD